MTPGARVQAAIEILDEILEGKPAEQALTTWARRSRFAGSKDRAAIRHHVFDALRARRSLAALGGAATGRGLMIGVVWSLLLIPAGFAVLAGAIAGTFLIWWIIDPKLRAVSAEYEAQQATYIEENEALTLEKAEA